MDDFLHVVQLTSDLGVLDLDAFNFLGLDLELFLLTREILLERKLLLLLLFQLLLDPDLLPPLFFKLALGFEEFLLLFHGLFHCFRPVEQFLLHALDLLEELRLFVFLLLLGLLFLAEFIHEALFVFFGHLSLKHDFLLFRIKLLLYHLFLLFELGLHCLHFVRTINIFNFFYNDLAVGSNLSLLFSSSGSKEIRPTVFVQFGSQSSDLVVELPDHRVFGILINSRLVLNSLRVTGIS